MEDVVAFKCFVTLQKLGVLKTNKIKLLSCQYLVVTLRIFCKLWCC